MVLEQELQEIFLMLADSASASGKSARRRMAAAGTAALDLLPAA